MTEQKTVLEVLKDIVSTLSNLRIPMSEMENIGFPVARSINEIRLCVEAMEREDEKKKAEAEKQEDNIVLSGEATQEEVK